MPTAPLSTRPQAVGALREIARALSAAWDLDTTLDLIVRQTTEVMHVDSCAIYLLDPDGETLRLRATTGLARRALGRAVLRVGEGMTGHAVRDNAPVFAALAQADPRFKRVDEAEETDFQSLLAVPLVIEDQPLGAMNVQTRREHRFDADDIEVLALIADLAAGALAKAQLYDAQRRQIEELQALAHISEAVTSPQYMDDMLDLVTGMAARTMNAAVCSIFLVDEPSRRLVLRAATPTTLAYGERPSLGVGEGVVGRVAANGQPAYIADVRTDPRYLGREQARAEGLVSLLAVPLSVRDQVIGVFNCYTDRRRVFSDKETSFFATLANQTALALENARLVTNAAVVREMHHRIKNNLQTVAMLMQLQLSDAERLSARAVLETNIHRIRSIATVHEVLSEEGFRLVDVKDVLARVIRATGETMVAPDRDVRLRLLGESIQLPSRAATALTLVVNELMQNALEHAFAGRDAGEVVVSLGRSAEEIVVLVRDNGRGLAGDYTPGLGLEIVETLVRDDLRGRLKINRLAQGTEFSLRMPRSIEQDVS